MIAFNSVREVNDLIRQRKNLQIEAFRLTEIFKTKVNSMAQKEVEDIFSKTMNKNAFKASTTLRLAKTFLSKQKVMQTWKGGDIEEINNEPSPTKKHPTKITEEQSNTVQTITTRNEES